MRPTKERPISDERPVPKIASALFFGLLMALELYAKASGFSLLPSQFWAAMPYLMTVVALTLISRRETVVGNAPACLGKPFLPST